MARDAKPCKPSGMRAGVAVASGAVARQGGPAPTLGRTGGGHETYSHLGTPSVWRNARSKVEALASNGMDEIDIPAFLRKQAD